MSELCVLVNEAIREVSGLNQYLLEISRLNIQSSVLRSSCPWRTTECLSSWTLTDCLSLIQSFILLQRYVIQMQVDFSSGRLSCLTFSLPDSISFDSTSWAAPYHGKTGRTELLVIWTSVLNICMKFSQSLFFPSEVSHSVRKEIYTIRWVLGRGKTIYEDTAAHFIGYLFWLLSHCLTRQLREVNPSKQTVYLPSCEITMITPTKPRTSSPQAQLHKVNHSNTHSCHLSIPDLLCTCAVSSYTWWLHSSKKQNKNAYIYRANFIIVCIQCRKKINKLRKLISKLAAKQLAANDM